MMVGAITGAIGAIFAIAMVLLGRAIQRHILRQEPDFNMSFMVAVAAIIIAAYLAFLIFGGK